jgi:3'-5' exoribonuclease
MDAPGGKLWHHAYLGGLLEHTIAVVELCRTMAGIYPMVNRDLLMTGAILHDIGKIEEYGYGRGFIDFTDEGRLWGHISIGAQCVRAAIEELEREDGFPEELKTQVVHLILSHQGELEHGSPVLPQTLEAMILYYADEMDSKANALKHIIERDAKSGRTWSQYINLLDRFIYIGNPEDKSS